jgi:hypothetical protein
MSFLGQCGSILVGAPNGHFNTLHLYDRSFIRSLKSALGRKSPQKGKQQTGIFFRFVGYIDTVLITYANSFIHL